jgi:hypothetical protein
MSLTYKITVLRQLQGGSEITGSGPRYFFLVPFRANCHCLDTKLLAL